MNNFLKIILIIVIGISGYLIYHFQLNKIPDGYEVVLQNTDFNNSSISIIKELTNDETIIFKNGFSEKEIISLNIPTYVREYYEDSFIFRGNKNMDYLIIVSSWDMSPHDLPDTFLGYNIYIYDGSTLSNSDQELLWFGKWFDSDYSEEDLIYSELSKQGIISELERIIEEGKI